jgi:hypothetical protein
MQDDRNAVPRARALDFLTASFMGPVPPPRLAPGERVLTEVALGRGDTAALTDRRVLLVGRNFERSLPLAHLALVHVRFEHIVREIVVGAVALLLALVLFAVASPVRSFFLGQATGLETAAAQERAAAAAPAGQEAAPAPAPGLAHGLQRMMLSFAAAARAIPVVAWLLVAAAVVKVALGIFGRTVVVFTAGGSDLEFARRGRDRLLREFISAVGGQLPPLGRLGVAPAPAAVPPPPTTVPPPPATLPPNGLGGRA